MKGITVQEERDRRLWLWADLDRNNITTRARPDDLRQRRVYGGAQGIWIDKHATGQIVGNEGGATVSILHTGRHYPDDLSDDGVIYHYPKTLRRGLRDSAEIEATKRAARLELPVFVILPGPTADTRSVRFRPVSYRRDPLNGRAAVPGGRGCGRLGSGPVSGQRRARTRASDDPRTATTIPYLATLNAPATGREHYTQTQTWKRSGGIQKTAIASICLRDKASGGETQPGFGHVQSGHRQ
jgi:hypothetical protein